jgi:hypothetical protein
VRQELASKFTARLNQIKPPDFEKLVQADFAAGPKVRLEGIADALLSLPGGPEAYIHLLQHPEEWRRLASLPEHVSVAEIGRLTARLTAPARRSVSNAPAPIRPVGGSATRVSKPPDEMDYQEYRTWRDKESKLRFRR